MIEVAPSLFIGDENDYELAVRHQAGWCIVHACKEPYHRQALGYQGRGAPKEHPEYLIAKRGNRLILNLVDAPSPAFFSTEIFDVALDFIDDALKAGNNVLVHCNEGFSRGPSVGLLFLAARLKTIPSSTFEEAEAAFIQLYPTYAPKPGVRGFMQLNWERYCG
jgi:hypothetical protein